MTTSATNDNGLPPSQVGSGLVASEEHLVLLKQAFVWALDSTLWPLPLKQSARNKFNVKRKRQLMRAYLSLLGRVTGLSRQFPQDERLGNIVGIVSAGIKELKANQGWIVYTAKGRRSWNTRRRTKPAIGPRLLLAICIAKELWPKRSPYQVVGEQLGHAQDKNPDAVSTRKRAIEKQVFRVIEQFRFIPTGRESRSEPDRR